MRITIEGLEKFCAESLIKEGMKPEYANMAARALTETDAYGIHSHGAKNLHNYIKKSRAGGLDLKAEPVIIKEGPAFAVIDAKNSMGMVSSAIAMKLACEKAKSAGIALVTVKNGCHFGAAGYYANMAASAGMIGLAFSNVDPNMNAPGARAKALGNNPISYASPAVSNPSVFLDIAMSNVASLKVFQARAEKRQIPANWIVDKDGLPTTDPGRYPEEGAMQPMSAHKGYGLAVLVDILTGVLSGGETSMGGNIGSWVLELDRPNKVCHTFIAIDAGQFLETGALEERTEQMAVNLRSLPKADGSERIYTPGEIEWERYGKALYYGIELPDDLLGSLQGLADDMGIELPVYN